MTPPTLADLTARQRQVLALIAEGLGDKQIARRLGISPNTVRSHTTNLYDLIGRGDGCPRVAAVLWYLRRARAGGDGS